MRGRFVVDVTSMKLTDEQVVSMERSIQKAMLTQLADWNLAGPEISIFLPEIWDGGLVGPNVDALKRAQEEIARAFG